MNRQSVLIGASLIAIALGLYFTINYFLTGQYIVSTDNAYVRADITSVSAKSTAYVSAISVADNTKVPQGTILLKLDPQDSDARMLFAQASLAQAEANLARARAQAASSAGSVRRAEATLLSQLNVVEEAKAATLAAEATRSVAAADRNRIAGLAQQGFVAPSRIDSADAAAKASSAQVVQAQAAVAVQLAQTGVLKAARDSSISDERAAIASIASAEASVEAARATLQAARNDLSYTEIRSPVAGLVANRTVQIGQLVSPGQLLLAIVPLDQVYVVANFKETQIGKLKPGLKVTFKVDAFPSEQVTGRLVSVSPASGSQFSLLPTDTATGNFTKITQRVPVRIAIDEAWRAKEFLRPGMSVVATVDIRESKALDPEGNRVSTQ